MTEHEKIIQTIEKHRSLFDQADCDLAITAKGIYFFYYYSKTYDDYYGFARFKTAEELEKIIIENVSSDFCMAADIIAENLTEVFRPIERHPRPIITSGSEEEDSYSEQNKLLSVFSALNEALTQAYKEIHPYEQWIQERMSHVKPI